MPLPLEGMIDMGVVQRGMPLPRGMAAGEVNGPIGKEGFIAARLIPLRLG